MSFVVFVSFIPAVAQQFNPSLFQEMRWRLIGPYRGGRTVAVSGVPGQPNVFYMAPNNGGVWKTTDAGRTWWPIFDSQPTNSIGALAVAPSNPSIIYVGSGEGLRRPDLSIGDGIYKSTDAGQTWQRLGLRDAQQIGAITIDPNDPDRVFVAVLGHPYGPNAERGLYRSLDGGRNWQQVLGKDENTGAIQVVFDPRNAQVVYAVLWNSRRPPWTADNAFEGPNSGLFKSTDGGTTWRQLTQGLPTSEQKLGRIGIGISPSDPSRIYALVEAPIVGGLFRSDDAGQSWRRVNNEKRIWDRGSDFACVAVDPGNKDKIYVANTSTYMSTDAGDTFTAIKGAPGGDDYHTIWISPDNPEVILLGVDQGATISVNGGKTWSSWYNQPTAQIYHVSTDNRFPYWVYGSQQESGSAAVASRSDYGGIGSSDWHPVGVEEYGYIAADPLDPNIIYGGRSYSANRFDQTTGQNQDISPDPLRTGMYRSNRSAPLMFSPLDPHTLLLGSNVLLKTTDGGHSWQEISPDLTREDAGIPPNLAAYGQTIGRAPRGVIYSIGPSFQDVNVIWVGTDDGLIHITRDAGRSWQNVTPAELTPWSKVAQLEASHFDVNSAYAAVNRFRLDDLHAYLYRTHDGGKSWQKITRGLPDDAAVNTVREDPVRKGLLFAGTEHAVYVSFNDGDEWQPLQLNLPATSMRDLTIHGDDLIVATHGRSFWVLDDITPLRQLTAEVAEAPAFFFAPQLTYRIRFNQSTDTPLPPEEPRGQNPPDGAIIDYYLAAPSSSPVMLEVFDISGRLVRSFSSDDKPERHDPRLFPIPTYWMRPEPVLSASAGMHRFVWDLRYLAPPALKHEYPIAAIYRDTPLRPYGPSIVPGEYSIRLAVRGRTYARQLTVKMDPRIKASTADLASQLELEQSIIKELERDYAPARQVQSLERQLQLAASRASGQIKDSLEAARTKLDSLNVGAHPPAPSSRRGLAGLNDDLVTLLNLVQSADAAPTTQAVAWFGAVKTSLDAHLKAWEEFKASDLPDLNRALKAAGFPEADVGSAVNQKAPLTNETENEE